MTIDLLRESDLSDALRLSTQAGWNQVDADWRRLLSVWPQSCFAGRIDGKLIATSTLATYGAALGWVGMVLVDQAHRGQGHGGSILDAALGAAKEAGVQTLGLDATDLGRPVYLKRGFRDFAGIDRWVLAPSHHGKGLADPAARAIAGDLTSNWEAALRFDMSATGVDRGALLRCLCKEAGVRAGALGPKGNLLAYAIHRPGRLATHLGPVVGESEAAATEVLNTLLEQPAALAQPILIDVPHGRLQHWLTSRGFTCSRRLTRMLAGCSELSLLGPQVFAALGFELG